MVKNLTITDPTSYVHDGLKIGQGAMQEESFIWEGVQLTRDPKVGCTEV